MPLREAYFEGPLYIMSDLPLYQPRRARGCRPVESTLTGARSSVVRLQGEPDQAGRVPARAGSQRNGTAGRPRSCAVGPARHTWRTEQVALCVDSGSDGVSVGLVQTRWTEELGRDRRRFRGNRIRPEHFADGEHRVGASSCQAVFRWVQGPRGVGPGRGGAEWPGSLMIYSRYPKSGQIFFAAHCDTEPPMGPS